MLEGITQFYLLIWLKTKLLETPFKGDNETALITRSNCENWVLYFSENIQKSAAFGMFIWFSLTKQ